MSKNLILVSFILFFLLSINLSSAIKIYVQPANQGIVRVNVSQFQAATVEKSFQIQNYNNYSVTINLSPSVNISKIVQIESSFTLQPNESRIVNYTIKVSEPGTYKGSIAISFVSTEGYVSYESDLSVIATKSGPNYILLIPAIVLVVIVVLIFLVKGRWKLTVKKKVNR
jgi:hypothetical protein